MVDLDEAIETCERSAKIAGEDKSKLINMSGYIVSYYHAYKTFKQVGDWLKELKGYREKQYDKTDSDFYQKYKATWERVGDKDDYLEWKCSMCTWQQRLTTNFCPYCGRRME